MEACGVGQLTITVRDQFYTNASTIHILPSLDCFPTQHCVLHGHKPFLTLVARNFHPVQLAWYNTLVTIDGKNLRPLESASLNKQKLALIGWPATANRCRSQ